MEPLPVLLGAAAVLALAAACAAALAVRRRRGNPSPSGRAGGGGEGLVSPRGPASEGPASAGPARVGLGLQGNLAQTPLHDLLQYLALGRKSGVLELASGRRTGRLVLSEGRIAGSAYRGKEGVEAAFLMMDLAEGDFEFYEPAPGQGRPEAQAPSLEVVDVIMLWMARKPKKKQA